MADALQDFSLMMNTASNLMGSLTQLQQTRTHLETERLSTQIGKTNTAYLMRMNLPVGDPNRIDMENWREELGNLNSSVNEQLSTIKSSQVKASVEARLGELTNGFMLNVSDSMVKQEIMKGKTDLNATVRNIMGDPLLSAMEKAKKIEPLIAYNADAGVLNPEESERLKAGIDGALVPQIYIEKHKREMTEGWEASVIAEQMKLNPGMTEEQARANLSEYEQPAMTSEVLARSLSKADNLDTISQAQAVQLLYNQQEATDKNAEETWKGIFGAREKDSTVDIHEAMNFIKYSGASETAKNNMIASLEGYGFKLVGVNTEQWFNHWRALNPADKFDQAESARARLLGIQASDEATGKGYTITDDGKIKIGGYLKEISAYLENPDDGNLKDSLRGQLVEATQLALDKEGSFKEVWKLYTYAMQEKFLYKIPGDVKELVEKIRSNTFGLDKYVLDALEANNGFIDATLQNIVNSTEYKATTKSFGKLLDRAALTGAKNDDAADAKLYSMKLDMLPKIVAIVQDVGAYNDVAKKRIQDEVIIPMILSTDTYGTKAYKNNEESVVSFYKNTQIPGDDLQGFSSARQQVVEIVNERAKEFGISTKNAAFQPAKQDHSDSPVRKNELYYKPDVSTLYIVNSDNPKRFAFNRYIKDGKEWKLERKVEGGTNQKIQGKVSDSAGIPAAGFMSLFTQKKDPPKDIGWQMSW